MSKARYSHMTDQELLNRFQQDGDATWMGVLLERYTLLLYGVCMKYLKDEHAAKDAVQQIFLKVLTDVSKYKIDFFKSWLYMVAKNHCLMMLRNNNAKQTKELTENHNSVNHDPIEKLKDEESTYTKLEDAIDELVAEQRQCVILFYLKKNSYQQISEKTGFSPMQVKSYIQNGKRNLRIILERKFKEEGKKNG